MSGWRGATRVSYPVDGGEFRFLLPLVGSSKGEGSSSPLSYYWWAAYLLCSRLWLSGIDLGCASFFIYNGPWRWEFSRCRCNVVVGFVALGCLSFRSGISHFWVVLSWSCSCSLTWTCSFSDLIQLSMSTSMICWRGRPSEMFFWPIGVLITCEPLGLTQFFD